MDGNLAEAIHLYTKTLKKFIESLNDDQIEAIMRRVAESGDTTSTLYMLLGVEAKKRIASSSNNP